MPSDKKRPPTNGNGGGHESWEEEPTPVTFDEDPVQEAARRARNASMNARQALLVSREVRDDLKDLSQRQDMDRREMSASIDRLETQQTAMAEDLSDVKVDTAKQTVQLNVLVEHAKEQRQLALQHESGQIVTRYEIDRAQAISQIKDTENKKEFHRELTVKGIAAIGAIPAVVATIVTWLATHC